MSMSEKLHNRVIEGWVKEYESAMLDAVNDHPDVNEDDVAHDVAVSMCHFMEPEVRRGFLDRCGFPFTPAPG